jgi:hypothetical protein
MVSASSPSAGMGCECPGVFSVPQEEQKGIDPCQGSLDGPIPETSRTVRFCRDSLEINDSYGKTCGKATVGIVVHYLSERGGPHLWISFFDGTQETLTALFQAAKKYVSSQGCEENQLCVFDGCDCGSLLRKLGVKESTCVTIDPPGSWVDQYADDMYGARSNPCFQVSL